MRADHCNTNGLVDGRIPAGKQCPFLNRCGMRNEHCPDGDDRLAASRAEVVAECAAVADAAAAAISTALRRADDNDDPTWAMGLSAQHAVALEIKNNILALDTRGGKGGE